MIYFFLTLLGALGTPLLAFAQMSTQSGFVSLSDIPAFNNIITNGAVDLSTVLNNIYGLCIGVAAVLAVIELMYAGVLYMSGDSITEKKVARRKIGLALFGLLLVLSPAIVFGVIDKRILSLKIDTGPLTTTGTATTDGSSAASGVPASGTWDSTQAGASAACTAQGGTPTVSGGTTHCTAKAGNCPLLTGTSVQIAADGSQDACCTGQYKLTKETRGQNSCTLSQ